MHYLDSGDGFTGKNLYVKHKIEHFMCSQFYVKYTSIKLFKKKSPIKTITSMGLLSISASIYKHVCVFNSLHHACLQEAAESVFLA